MSSLYLKANSKNDNGLLPQSLTRVFRADFVFDDKKFETSIAESVYQEAKENRWVDSGFDPIMWYCSQVNEDWAEIKWWDTPNTNNCDIFDNIHFPQSAEKEIFPYNTPIKCEEQVLGCGKITKRTFWLKKVVVQRVKKNNDIEYLSCMAEGKKKNGIYKIKTEDKDGGHIGWVLDLISATTNEEEFCRQRTGIWKFMDLQGIDRSKIVKKVYTEIKPDGKIC